MMLPPVYRDLWKKEFKDLKYDDFKQGKSWTYEADPFAAKQERDEVQATMAKKRDEREKEKLKAAAAAYPTISLAANVPSNGHSDRNVTRGWTRVPKIEMGKRTRAQVESIIRRDAIWNTHGASIAESQRRKIVSGFSGLSFPKKHVPRASYT